MIEWQAEAGLFTIRIRGKQWYWIYKFELKTFTDILTAPKNLGRNKWAIYTPTDLETSNDYLHVLQLRSQNKWVKKYWNKYLLETSKTKNYHISSPQEQLSYIFNKNINKYELNNNLYSNNNYLNFYDDIFEHKVINENKKLLLENSTINTDIRVKNKKINWDSIEFSDESYSGSDLYKFMNIDNSQFNKLWNFSRAKDVTISENFKNFFLNSFNKNEKNIFFKFNDFNNIARWLKRSQGTPNTLRIFKNPILMDSLDKPFGVRFSQSDSSLVQKTIPHTTFLTMKQKRYSRKKVIFPRTIVVKDELGKKTTKTKFSGKLSLYNNESFEKNYADATKQYRFFRKNKKRYENTSVILSKRMLRTRRTLVLPAHVNLTAITNSYDVVHSWFIPGLGLKLDCIPGRATHHTFYIDNVGFYYGQCAEICGRYHHHMPIRICALPFEHFLVWWYSFGLPKLISTRNKKRYETYYGNRKYIW